MDPDWSDSSIYWGVKSQYFQVCVLIHGYLCCRIYFLQCAVSSVRCDSSRSHILNRENYTNSLLWGLWYPCLGILVLSAIGFKGRVDPHLCASSPACNAFLRFTSGVTAADLLTASMAAEHFWSTYFFRH